MNIASPHPRKHRLTSSFTDSAIEVELSSNSAQSDDGSFPIVSSTSFSLSERLSYIAHLAAENSARGYSVDEHAAINKCLGDSETLLLVPRPGISRAIALNRPSGPSSSPPSRTATPTPIPTTTTPTAHLVNARPRKEAEETFSLPRNQTITEQTSVQLKSVLSELSSVNEELRQRYIESRHIHDVFIIKCEGLAQRIIELENEVHELKSDILEDTIELEGLRGTIRGLESWVNRWQRQREAAIASSNPARRRRPQKSPSSSWRWKKKKQSTNHDHEQDVVAEEEGEGNEDDFDTFLDGILAWMRGWNDVEEGFLVRARRRKMRRDQKSSIA